MRVNVIMLQKISWGSVAPQTDQLPIEQLWEEQSCSLLKGGRISLVQYSSLFLNRHYLGKLSITKAEGSLISSH